MHIKVTNDIKRHFMKERTKIDAANLFLVQQMSEDPLFEYDEEYHRKPIDAIAADFYTTTYADNTLLEFVLSKIEKAMITKGIKSAREQYLNDDFVKTVLLKGLYTSYERSLHDECTDIHAELTLTKCEKNDLIEFGDYAYIDGIYVPRFAKVNKTFFNPILMGNSITYSKFTIKDYLEVKNKTSKLKGRVLVLNDVFGYMMYHASQKKDVEEIVVVCDDGDMNFHFLKDFILKNCKEPQKIKIINQDILEYVKGINENTFDYVFANICEFASADEMLIRRELKLKGIQCDYHLENHYAKYLAPTISTIFAEELGIDGEYVQKRQGLIVNQEKYKNAQMIYDDGYGEDEEYSDYEDYIYGEDYDINTEDDELSMEELAQEWIELINEMIEDTQFEVDMTKSAYEDVEIETVDDIIKAISAKSILERL